MAKIRDWRKKHKKRFEDDALIAVKFEAGAREVFDYHERICDRIDDAGKNETRVSLGQLAREIHDDPSTGESYEAWVLSRTSILEGLRDLEKISFEGDVQVHRTLTITLPEETYRKWHTNGNDHTEQQRDEHGRFGKKPASTVQHRTGSESDESRSVDGPSADGDGADGGPSRTVYQTRPNQTRPDQEAADAAPRAHMREAAAAQVSAGSHPDSGVLPSVTNPDAKANDERVRCQRVLGSSSLAVQEIVDHHAAKFPGASPARVVREVWQPLASLRRRLPDVFDAALSKALRRSSPAWSGQLVVQIAEELAVEHDSARGALPAGETDEFDELVQPYTVEAS